jgi:hypothetical protein
MMMHKDISYHRAAVQYNEELANLAEDLANRLEHEEVARWALSVSKQHRFHAGRHKKALTRLENAPEGTVDEGDDEEDKNEDVVPPEEQVAYRSAETGEYVSEEFAEANPTTTVKESGGPTPTFSSKAKN